MFDLASDPTGPHNDTMVASDFQEDRVFGLDGLFRERLPSALHSSPSMQVFDPQRMGLGVRSDFDLTPETVAELDLSRPPRPAAVLIPIVLREQLTVLLTQRAAHLPSHAGQIAFPGGKIDPEDDGPISAALREAKEEIGLAASYVEPVGFLDNYHTRTGFHIVPVVAYVEPGFSLEIEPAEVDDVFEVPLSFLMSAENHLRHHREWRGTLRYYYAMPFGERYIWGATAGMLKNLHDKVFCT